MEDWFFNLVKVNGSQGWSVPRWVVHSLDYPLETPGELFKNVSACRAPPLEILI